MGSDLRRPQSCWPFREEGKHLRLARVHPRSSSSRPQIRAQHEGDPLEALAQANDEWV
jgi:hypothetical protein